MVFSEIMVCCKCVLISMPTQFWPERCRRQDWGLKYNRDVFYKKKKVIVGNNGVYRYFRILMWFYEGLWGIFCIFCNT